MAPRRSYDWGMTGCEATKARPANDSLWSTIPTVPNPALTRNSVSSYSIHIRIVHMELTCIGVVVHVFRSPSSTIPGGPGTIPTSRSLDSKRIQIKTPTPIITGTQAGRSTIETRPASGVVLMEIRSWIWISCTSQFHLPQ